MNKTLKVFLVTLSDTVRGTENVSLTRFVLFDLFFNSDLRLGCLPSTHSCEVNTLTHKHANMYTGWQVSASARVAIATRSAALFALWLPRAWHRGPSVVVRSQVRRLIYLFFFMRSHSTHGHFHTDPCTPCMNCVCVFLFCFVLFFPARTLLAYEGVSLIRWPCRFRSSGWFWWLQNGPHTRREQQRHWQTLPPAAETPQVHQQTRWPHDVHTAWPKVCRRLHLWIYNMSVLNV